MSRERTTTGAISEFARTATVELFETEIHGVMVEQAGNAKNYHIYCLAQEKKVK